MSRFVIVAVVILAFATNAHGQVFTVGADRDSWIEQASPAQNHWDDDELQVRASGADSALALFHFDLSSIPPGTFVASAVLNLTVTAADASGNAVHVYPVGDTWNEGSVTWANTAGDVDLATLRGSFEPAYSGVVSIDVTSLVAEWLGASRANYGLALSATSAAVTSRYASREWATAEEQPRLVVVTQDYVKDNYPVRVGNYNGNGSGSQHVNIGFQPDLVIINPVDAGHAMARTSSMLSNAAKELANATALVSNEIIAFDATGFTVGPAANQAARRFRWIAFKQAPGILVVDSYNGNGVAAREVAVGFHPAYVMVMGAVNQPAQQRVACQAPGLGLPFDSGAETAMGITGFTPDGFSLSASPAVNTPGVTYHYAAWSPISDLTSTGCYTGDGSDNRDIAATQFRPDNVFVKNAVGGTPVAQRLSTFGNADTTLAIGTDAPYPDGIQKLLAGGFQVGTHPSVNAAGAEHFWAGFGTFKIADLAVSAGVDDATPDEGQAIQYTIGVTNLGPDSTYSVDVTDLLPGGVTYVSHVASQGAYDDGTGAWTVGALTASAAATLTISAVVDFGTFGGTITNTAAVSYSDRADPVAVNDTASVAISVGGDVSADVGVAVGVDSDTVIEGDAVVFTVRLANAGPDSATGLVVTDLLPVGLAYSSHIASAGAYNDTTGAWVIGGADSGMIDSLRIVATVLPGTAGTTLVNRAAITASSRFDPTTSDHADSVAVRVTTPVILDDEPGSLYPGATFAGQPDLKIHVGVNNPATIGVLLDVASTVTFTDGANTFTAPLANATHVPASAGDFTLSFAAGAVPAFMATGASYPLALALSGTTDESVAYAETLVTTGSNEIYVEQTRVGLAATAVGNTTARPGARDVVLLALEMSNGYNAARSLDSLTVTNATAGPGTLAQLDAEVELLRLYNDLDQNGTLSAPDVALAGAVFTSGRAVFVPAGAWTLPAGGTGRLLVTADVDSTLASDGDAVDALVQWASDIVFVEPTVTDDVSPLSPLNSTGAVLVDGMAAHQLALFSSAPDTLYSGAVDRLVATVVVPQNGYRPDVLTGLEVADVSGGFASTDLSALRLYVDDGDSTFDPSADAVAGVMVFSGDRYTVTGLSTPIAGATRLFVAADVAAAPGNGDSFRASIPLDGVKVASGNDGPVDAVVSTAADFVFVNVEQIDAASLALAAVTPNPGRRNVTLLHLRLVNSTLQPATLDAIDLENATRGSGSSAELDGAMAAIRVYADDGNGLVDPWDTILADGLRFSGGTLSAGGLGATLGVGAPYHLLVACDVDSFCAADLDTLAVRVSGPAALHVDTAPGVVGGFPFSTGQLRVVDGMMSHQIVVVATADSAAITTPFDNRVFDFELNGNGYLPDTLTTIELENLGTATPAHITRMAFYADGGDGAFDAGAGDDVGLGDFAPVGISHWSLAGLDVALSGCASATRFFVAVDLAADPPSGASIQLSIPVGGVGVASGNDGPIDTAVANPSVQFVPKPDELTVFPYSVGNRRSLPGARDVLNFGVGFYNGFNQPVTLTAVNLFQQGTTVSGELDAAHAYADTDSNGLFTPGVDQLLASIPSTSTYYPLSPLDLVLRPKKVTYLFVTYDLALTSRDSVSVDFQINDPSDFDFDAEGLVVRGEFPVNSPGVDVTNGMVAAQIDASTAPQVRVSPGQNGVFAAQFTVPTNGFRDDEVRFVTIRNAGTAAPGQDISTVNLWIEDNGDDSFDPMSDQLAATLTWYGSGWRNPSPMALPVVGTGLRCYVSVDLAPTAADNRTLQLMVPVNGIQVGSGNDGPIDAAIVNGAQQIISTDPLLATISLDRATYSQGQSGTLSLHVRNAGLTPLSGVHPGALTVTGSGTFGPLSGPSPASVDLAPGAEADIEWTFSAANGGRVDVCAVAFDTDSTEASEETCAGAVVQTPPALLTVALDDIAPTGANRGQQNVSVARLTLSYSGFDTLSTTASLAGLDLGLVDQSDAPIAPNTRLSGVKLASSTGRNFTIATADSSSSPMRFRFSPPVTVAPGAVVELDVTTGISSNADLAPFAVSVGALNDIDLRDANDGLAIVPTTSETFPWIGNPVAVTLAAETLLVASTDTGTATVNFGQPAVTLLAGTFLNDGPAQSADMRLSRVSVRFYDLAGMPVDPGEVIRSVSLVADGAVQCTTESFTMGSNRVDCNVSTTFLLSAGAVKPFELRVDTRIFPTRAGFYAEIEKSTSVVARDDHGGEVVPVRCPGQAAFPQRSRTLVFQAPATRLEVSGINDSPETILPSASNVRLMTLALVDADTVGAAEIVVDSLAVNFVDPLGNPLHPGDWLSSLRLQRGTDTLAVSTSLSITDAYVRCRLSPPLVLSPGDSDSVAVFVDAKGLVAPTQFYVRVDRNQIRAVDANDGQRVLGLAGEFPLVEGPYWLRIPSANVFATVASRLPANVSGHETNLGVFDVTLENRNPAGYTSTRLSSIKVALHDSKRGYIDADAMLTGARLTYDDTVSVSASSLDSVLTFTFQPALVIEPGQSARFALCADLNVAAVNCAIRMAIRDPLAIVMRDASTDEVVAPQGGFPLMSTTAQVLGAGEQGGFTNYPNPFAAGREPTRITYFLDEPSRVTMKLYTLWGRPVATLLSGAHRAGGLHQDVSWDGRTADGDVVNNGVYYLVVDITGDSGASRSYRRKVGVVR